MSGDQMQVWEAAPCSVAEANARTVPPGYKSTEVGVIPEEWGAAEIGDFFEITSSKRVFQRDWKSHGVPFYRAREISELAAEGSVANDLFISEELFREYRAKYGVPQPGDVLVTGVGTLGQLYIVRPSDRFYFKDASVLWFKSLGTYSSELLKQLFQTPLVSKQITDSSTGTTVGTYTIGGATHTRVPFPPLDQQRTIAEALSDVDGLLGALEALIAKKRAIKQAAMQQLLTGKTRLPGFSGPWEMKPFGAILERLNAKGLQIQSSEYQATGRYPVIDQGNVPIVGFSDDDSRLFKCPDGGVIVFGDHTCIVKFVSFHFVIGADGTQVIKAKSGQATRFFAFQLQHHGVESTGYNRHFKFLREREFMVPPPHEQVGIANVLSDMDAEIAMLERRRDKSRAIKQGMMQQLLTGRVRLVTPEAARC